MTVPEPSRPQFGSHLREWRLRRRYSQLALSLEANVSARHISFLEGGRAKPSRAMVQNLAECLDMPFEARNALLAAAGFVPLYERTPLEAEHLGPIREALIRMMHAHSPAPALILDSRWNVLDANPTGAFLMGDGWQTGGCLIERLVNEPELRAPMLNWPEVAAVMITRLRAESRQAGGDPHLDALAARLEPFAASPTDVNPDQPILTFRYATPLGELALFTMVAELSSAQDLTLRELRLEMFFPADSESKARLTQIASLQD